MRLGAAIGRDNPDSMAKKARDLEDAGVDIVWVAELYGFDGVSLMGFLAGATRRVLIGSAILPFYSRTPSLLAMSAAGVDQLSGGRCILGIGASGPQVIEGFHGVPFDAPVGRVEEIIDICHTIWRREPLVHRGRHYQIPLINNHGPSLGKPLKMIDHPVRDQIPIFVAGIGIRNVEMTARYADGWIPFFFWPERWAQVWAEPLNTGIAARAEGLGSLEVVASTTVAIGEGLEDLRDAVRPQLALYIGGMGSREKNFYNDLACRYGLERAARRIQDHYLAGRRDEAIRAVPEELVSGTTMIGPPGLVKDRLAAYKAAGVTVLNIRTVGQDPKRDLALVREWIDE
jgi:F420-dependent oxidoreductase-like protein